MKPLLRSVRVFPLPLTLSISILFSLPIVVSFLSANAAYGQTSVPPFKHVVIIFQENRTPDNIFGSAPAQANCTQEDPFEPGVDIVDGGPNKWSPTGSSCSVINPGLSSGGSYHNHKFIDPKHPGEYVGWVPQCDYDAAKKICKMDGASHSWEDPNNNNEYQYVNRPAVEPYFDIATSYGFANYMFATHEGPSFEGHQFIFGGSSAPVFPGNTYYDWFLAENPSNPLGQQVGCPATGTGWPKWVDPDNDPESIPIDLWCYDRNTLVTYQDSRGVHDWTDSWPPLNQPQLKWKYYMPTGKKDPNSAIWNAPEDDPQTCYFAASGGGSACHDQLENEYENHISVADPSHNMLSAPILTDIQNCQLPAISWVIPDERWSDHPGSEDHGLGPDWVAAIVDAIGESYTNSTHRCAYWGYPVHSDATPEQTAIFVTWDDWGGFYDHVPPPKVYLGDQNDKCPQTQDNPNGWGCGYVFGFRVPLLVISNWTPTGYVSGPISGQPTYPPNPEWTHDFGSILRFTELNFTNQGLNLPTIAPPGGNPPYTYADQNSLDATFNHHPAVPLWDFFQGPQRTFTQINPIDSSHTASFFQSYYQTQQADGTYPQPTGPEAGDPMD